MGKYKRAKQNIRQLMRDHKNERGRPMTQDNLADLLGKTQTNVNPYLNCEKDDFFNLADIITIADYFNVTIDSILGRELKKNTDQEKTYADVLKALVFILENTDVHLHYSPCDKCKPFESMGIDVEHPDNANDYDLCSFLKAYRSIMNIDEWSRSEVLRAYIDSQMRLAASHELMIPFE